MSIEASLWAIAGRNFKQLGLRLQNGLTRHRLITLLIYGFSLLAGAKPVRHISPAAWAMIAIPVLAACDGVAFTPDFWPSVGLFALLVIIFLFDARFYIIPDRWLVALAVLWIFTRAYRPDANITDSIAGLLAGFLGLLGLSSLYFRWKKIDGIGFGDIKLLGLCGLWVGLSGLPIVLVVATCSALFSVLILALSGQQLERNTAIAFGPHLCLGLWFTWCL